MPHKHKRKRGDDNDYDLPPSQRAKSLPVLPKQKGDKRPSRDGAAKAKANRKHDKDAPRAFRRLMAVAQGKKIRSGLDDGVVKKASNNSDASQATFETPTIRPGEDLRSFSARVNAALPVAGLAKKPVVKDGKDEQGFKIYRTRKEYKMHKLYDQWRDEERKIQEGKEDEAEREAERELDDDADNITSRSFASLGDNIGATKRTKKGKRIKDVDDDPWEQLKKKRAEAKVGLFDVAQAPPELHRKLSKPLRDMRVSAQSAGDASKTFGSQNHPGQRQQTRHKVSEAYRKIQEYEQARLRS